MLLVVLWLWCCHILHPNSHYEYNNQYRGYCGDDKLLPKNQRYIPFSLNKVVWVVKTENELF